MEKKTLIKEKTILEAQKYELDEDKIKLFYGIKDKPDKDYNMIAKNIIFSKENSISKIDNKLKLSHYQTFRQLLLSEFNLEEMKEEYENANSLIIYSEQLRKYLNAHFNFSEDFQSTPQIEESKQISSSIFKPKKLKNVIQTVMFADDFLQKCKLLKLKQNEDTNQPIRSQFKLFSDLDKKTDTYYQNPRDLNIKFYNKKQKLLQCFNREHNLISYISKIRDGEIKLTPDSLPVATKDKFSSEFVDSLFDLRNESHFIKIDSFILSYIEKRLSISKEEKNLYLKIYSILCKNNYMNFLSFLYSKNSLFKFIYDEFSDKDAVADSFDLDNGDGNIKMNEFKEMKEITHIGAKDFANNNSSDEVNNSNASFLPWRQRHSTVYIKKNIDLYEQMAGCYSFLKIGIVTEIINAKYIEEFFCDDENQKRDFIEMDFYTFLDKCSKIDFNYAMIISKDKKLKVFSPNSSLKILDNDNNFMHEIFSIEEKMTDVTFYNITKNELSFKLNPKVIDELYADKANSNPLYPSCYMFYLIKVSKNDVINYYLFKIAEKFVENFENVLKYKFSLKNCTKIKKDSAIPIQKEKSESEDDNENDFKHRDIAEQPDYIDEVKEIIRESNSVGIDSNKDKITAKNLFGAINDTFNNGNVKEEEKENKSTENDNEEYIDTGVPNRIKEDSVHHSNNGINQASILNSSSVSDTSKSSGIKNIIKENNMKKTENFQFK